MQKSLEIHLLGVKESSEKKFQICQTDFKAET